MVNKEKEIDSVVRHSPMEIPFLVMAHWNAKVPLHFIAEPSTVKSEGTVSAAKQIAEREQRVFFEWNRRSMEEKRSVLAEPEKYLKAAEESVMKKEAAPTQKAAPRAVGK